MAVTYDQRYLNIQNPARSIKWDSGLSDVMLYASDDRILFQDLNSYGEIRCYSPNDGKILWKFKTPGFGNAPGVFNSVLAFTGNKAIISEMYHYKEPGTPSKLSHLFEFDMSKGKILKMIDNCVSYSKVNNKKKLLISTQNGSIVESFMFNLESGNKEWSVEGSISDIWQDENYMLTAGSANKITKIDLLNGRVIWSHDYKGLRPFFESIENNILTITIASNPKEIAQEHSDEPWKVFDTYSTMKLDFESGKEIDYFISYDRTKSTQTPIKIKEYYHFDKINIEKSYEVPLENIFSGNPRNEENLIVYDKSKTKIFEGVFKGYITSVYSFGDTFIVFQPKLIQAYKNGKFAWKTETYSSNNGNPILFDKSKNCLYLFDAKPLKGNATSTELLEFDVEKGETGFSIKLDYASLNKDKDYENPFKCNYGYKVENGFVNYIKLPEIVTQIVTNHFY